MRRLKCNYSEFIAILENHEFTLMRHEGTSHQQWRREDADGNVWNVTVTPHRSKSDIPTDTLMSMIRQLGLPKRHFRK